jgi:hypothetical protein
LKLDIPQLESGKQECEGIKKSLTLVMMNEDYVNDKWTHVFTDGSATTSIKDGGAGILIIHPSGHRVTNHIESTAATSKQIFFSLNLQHSVRSGS